MITSVLDAEPLQIARIGGPSPKPMLAAATLGGVFILSTFHLFVAAAVSGVLALAAILWWLWSGTGIAPEKPAKHAGRGIVLPLYSAGPASPGWWAMVITMTADATAFASLMFGYFFYWTVRTEFPPLPGPGLDGPGVLWPMISLSMIFAGWLATLTARAANRRFRVGFARAALLAGAGATAAGAAAALAGPWTSGLEPTIHVYPAIVWVLALWVAAHAALAVVMQLFVLARSIAGRMTPTHDHDVRNVAVYVHFLLLTALVALGVLGLFPELA